MRTTFSLSILVLACSCSSGVERGISSSADASGGDLGHQIDGQGISTDASSWCVKDSECMDSDPCTIDKCGVLSGKCYHEWMCDDGVECTHDSCEPENGGCQHVPDDKLCKGGNACTFQECKNIYGTSGLQFACVYSVKPVNACDDGNACTVDSCDIKSGCQHVPLAEDATCTHFGNLACENQKCTQGACTTFKKDCDDGNECTFDFCDVWKGCQHEPTAQGNCCLDSSDCHDFDTCTYDYCDLKTKKCKHEKSPNCCMSNLDCQNSPRGKYCYNEYQAGPGKCQPCMPNQNGAFPAAGCNTNNQEVCEVVSKAKELYGCVKVECKPTKAQSPCSYQVFNHDFYACSIIEPICDDNNPCTKDSCDPKKGCVHMPIPGAVLPVCCAVDSQCNDGNPYTQNLCFGSKGCKVIDPKTPLEVKKGWSFVVTDVDFYTDVNKTGGKVATKSYIGTKLTYSTTVMKGFSMFSVVKADKNMMDPIFQTFAKITKDCSQGTAKAKADESMFVGKKPSELGCTVNCSIAGKTMPGWYCHKGI